MPELLKLVSELSDSNDTDKVSVSLHSTMSSISSQASKTTYYFPVLVSKNVDPESCYLIADHLDYMYAYFMRACFSLTPAIDITNSDSDDINVEDYLRRFHQNAGVKDEEYGIKVELPKKLIRNAIGKIPKIGPSAAKAFGLFANESADPLSDFEYLSNKPLNEATFREQLKSATVENSEILANSAAMNKYNTESDRINSYYDSLEKTEKLRRDNMRHSREEEESINANKNDEAENRALKAGYEKDIARVQRDKAYRAEAEERANQRASLWTAKEAEKRNSSAQPLVIPVTCTFLKGDFHEIPVNIPIGIKTIIHDCDPIELRDVVKASMTGHSLRKGFIRWKTGELDSLGDVLFGIKDMRKAVSGSTELRRWQDVVTRRKLINRFSLANAGKKEFLPNTTVIVSMEDIEEIERLTKIDVIKDVKYAYRMMKDSMLLAFVIADCVNEKAYILYDGHTEFESVPYKAIERDNKKDNKMIENLIKVMAIR